MSAPAATPAASPAASPVVSPVVSIVTPVWNAAATLAEAAASAQAQTFADWEMLIVDDGSTDGSRALAERLAAADPRLRVLGWAANRGAAAARNAGLRAARGRVVAFLDADDRWLPPKLERQLAQMAATGAPFVFASYRRIDAAGRPLGVVRVPARVDHARLLRGNAIPCQTAAFDRAHYGPVEMPDLRRRQDYGLWLMLLARGGAALGLDEVLAEHRIRPGSLSSDKLAAAAGTWRVYREVAGLSRPRAALCLASNLTRGALKRLGG
jgi:teichuronic acid biosynthesis glycosyltransferase TuaG